MLAHPSRRSGAGKTTVASLLERLYTVDGGGIYLGGQNIADFERAEWVAALTAVSQEPVLFAGGWAAAATAAAAAGVL